MIKINGSIIFGMCIVELKKDNLDDPQDIHSDTELTSMWLVWQQEPAAVMDRAIKLRMPHHCRIEGL
jgi:hypothetical protein